ncbi:DNA primase [Candidatus Microgenomates bacterium]|nr:DNA primase [Candidatus Microgenomates bacterium]
MDQIEEVRNKTDIVELISEYVTLKKSGRSFRALCPFHSETKPSFFVSPELQIFKCFGCGVSGNVFNFLMEIEGMAFGEALRFLAKKAGVRLKQYRPTGKEKEREFLFEINHLASEFYHYLLTKHRAGKKALRYTKIKRKISDQSIEKFKLGYAPNMWDGLIQFLVGKKGYKVEDLERAGLVIRRRDAGSKSIGYYDRFRNRLIFPLFDHQGNVCGFAGRVIEKKEDVPKYINTPETPVYHKSNLLYGLETTRKEVKRQNLAIVVEGELDAISSYQAGVENVVAIKGSALTSGQVRLLSRFCESIALALDVDIAGDAAAVRGIEITDKAGLNIRVIRPLFGKDPDECVRQSAKLWQESVQKTIPIWDFYIESAFEKYEGKTAESKKKIGKELIPFIAKISNEIAKAHYIKVLANRLGVDEEVVMREMEKSKTDKSLRPSLSFIKASKGKEKSRREVLEEYLLALILQNKMPINDKIEIVTPAIKKIWEKIPQKKGFSIKSFYQNLPEELRELAGRLYLRVLSKVKIRDEIEKTIKELKRLGLKEQLKELAAKENLVKFSSLSQKLKEFE